MHPQIEVERGARGEVPLTFGLSDVFERLDRYGDLAAPLLVRNGALQRKCVGDTE